MSILTVTPASGLKFPNTDIAFTVNHKSDAGTLVNATSISMKIRDNQDTVSSATLTNTGTGIYTATARPKTGGWLNYQITATYNSVDTVLEGRTKVDSGFFEDQNNTSDYD